MRPGVIWCPSPNFRVPLTPRKITMVVIHATATAGLDSPKAWLCNPTAKVSAHYLISKQGTTYCLVEESRIAWHANPSVWKGQENVNAFSIGIELVNANTGSDVYPDLQVKGCAYLVAAICKDYGIKLEDVVGHVDVVSGKTPEEKAEHLKEHSDPKGFPWDAFREMLKQGGIA